jgi:hypothetical protein
METQASKGRYVELDYEVDSIVGTSATTFSQNCRFDGICRREDVVAPVVPGLLQFGGIIRPSIP